jgi:TolB protein
MTIANSHRLSWIAAIAAFLIALMATGCARELNSTTTALQPASPPLVLDLDLFAPSAEQAPIVNIFGELDGLPQAYGNPLQQAGYQRHTRLEEGSDSHVAADPTGRWIVFASTRHSEQSKLYTQRVNGTTVTQLTSGGGEDAFPAFSPCGTRIAFASTRAGPWNIFTMDLDGRNVTQVTEGPSHDLHPSFSPDGRRLVYCATGTRSGQWELWVVELATGQKQMIGYGLFPRWSPSREVDRIAFQRPRQRGSRWFSLWTLDLIDGEARRLTEVTVSSNAAIVTPAWSPDGNRLAFVTIVSPSDNIMSRAITGQQDIWTINADGTNRQRLTDGTGTNLMPFWSVDNRVYFISDRGGAESVWSIRTDVPATMSASLDACEMD